MARKRHLNDLQLILLSTASARDDGHVFPLKDSIAGRAEDVGGELGSLIKRRLLEPTPAPTLAQRWKDEEGTCVGLVITQKARALLDSGPVEEAQEPDKPTQIRVGSKTQLVLTLLGREKGASSRELTDATGWLPHTMRAALTGLRKKGHEIGREKRDGQSVYRLMESA